MLITTKSQIPQLWSEYLPVEVESARIRRIEGIATSIADKKAKAAAAKKKKADAALAAMVQRAARVPRIRKKTARAQVCLLNFVAPLFKLT